LRYRSEIDGLRAVSVLGVVAYHAFPRALTGGFVGVDVFFVISGFLITSNILSDCAQGRFSIARFYEKRARRLLPALAAVLAAATLAALILLPPHELRDYGASLLWVSGFLSNVHFRLATGYFAHAAADQPLLHTWSLAVEEQFYIAWPLVVAWIARGQVRRLRPIVWIASLASLALAQWWLGRDPTPVFYLMPFRAWELGLGALIAVGALPTPGPRAAEVLSGLGLGMVVTAMLLIDSHTPFPGIAAGLPCVGAMLFLHATAGTPTIAARAASWRPAVFVGLISYSLYLWHWPVLVFGRIVVARPLSAGEALAALALAFGLATLSWQFVERPFRRPGSFTRSQILGGGAALLSAGALGGLMLVQTQGLRALASPGVLLAERAGDSMDWRCLQRPNHALPVARVSCTSGLRRDGYDALLWGDSHANHFAPALRTAAVAHGLTLREATEGACWPVLGPKPPDLGVGANCLAFNRAVIAEARADPRLGLVVVAARWNSLVRAIADGGTPPARMQLRITAIIGGMLADLRRTLGPHVRIVVIGSTPEFDIWIAQCYARERRVSHSGDRCDRLRPTDSASSGIADAAIERVVSTAPGVSAVFPRALFCTADHCRTRAGNTILIRDDHHLTNEGGGFVVDRLFDSPRIRALGLATRAGRATP
jgi:peptidoglycan/LPS O-acetylase OafA/YrhL